MSWFRTIACGCVVLLVLSVAPAHAQGKKPAAKEIDAGTIAVYKKLGAEYGGWVGSGADIYPAWFLSEGRRAEYEDNTAPTALLPGFQFRTFPMARLPRVGVPFGLSLVGSKATDADMEQLEDLDNLILLDLRNNKVTDAGLKGLAGFGKLSTLRLEGRQGSAAGLKHLSEMKGLASLTMQNVKIDEATFKALGDLKNLQELRLSPDYVRPDWIKHLAGLKLHTLTLSQFESERHLDSKSLDALSEIGLLHALLNTSARGGARPKSADEVVSLRANGLTPGDMKRFMIFKNLTSLQLSGVQPGSKAEPSYENLAALLKDVAKFEKLAEIDFGYPLRGRRVVPHGIGFSQGVSLSSGGGGSAITGVGLSELASLENLASLNLYGARLRPAGVKELAALKHLTTLNLGETPVMDKDLKNLASLTKLTSLNLQGTEVTNAGMKDVAGFKNLTDLSLGHTRVRDFGVKGLAGLANLTALDLSDTEVTDAALRELVGMKKLATLNLLGTRTTDAGIAELQKALPNCKIDR